MSSESAPRTHNDGRGNHRRALGIALRALGTLAIFAALFWKLPAADVWDAMSRTGWARWLAVMPLFALAHVVAASKWRMLVRAAGVPLGFATALRAHAAGLFANIWLPSIIGGDVVRAGLVARAHGGLAVPAIAGIADRALDLAALLTLAAFGALLAPASALGSATPLLRGAAIALALGGAAALAALNALDPARLPQRLRRPAVRAREVLGALARQPARAATALGASLLVQGSLVALNAWLGAAIGVAPGAAGWLLAWPLAKIVAMAPISLGGLGVRETALASLLAPFGVPATTAVAQGLVWQSVLFGFGVVAGAWAWLGRRREPQ